MNPCGSSSDKSGINKTWARTKLFSSPEFPENREQRLVSVPIIRELSGKIGNRDFSQSQLSGNCPGKLGTETFLSPNCPGTVRENREQRLVSVRISRIVRKETKRIYFKPLIDITMFVDKMLFTIWLALKELP